MDELGFNKVAGAVLATGLGVMALINAPKVLIKDHYPATPAYSIGELEKADEGDAEPLPFPQAEWVNAMDAAKGAKVFNKCKSCHNVENGGSNGTGPNLHNIVGAAAGAKDGFSYSGAMSGSGLNWGYEELDGFLTKPSKYLKGTKMSFIGLKKAEDRAAVIEYLRVASSSPVAQPTPAASEAMAPETTDGTIMEAAETMIDGAKDKADTMIEGGEAMIDGGEAMIDSAKDKADSMIEGGEAMIDGAKDKADSMIEGTKDKAGDKMNALKDQAKDKVKEKADDGN